ncbi:hypothetical protein CLF_104201 [Clonorchis sinensis]|uniref:Uncharacterized protein n=1 Tax=Clonorchis sinensis TaxID=79923 RepID=G7YNS9_CLOSI|nr:hypothetical protein CLF_104201 [Clonorchis sinensis]
MGEVRDGIPLGASSADRKLMAKPIVDIAPCAPESTPNQPAATTDSSFYSTTTDPSATKGGCAHEKASLAWKPCLNPQGLTGTPFRENGTKMPKRMQVCTTTKLVVKVVLGGKLRPPKIKDPRKRDSRAAKAPANGKQPSKTSKQEADKYAIEAPSAPSTQTPRAAIKSAYLSGYTTLGSSPSGAAETVLNCLSTNCLSRFNKLCLEQPFIIALIETWLTPDASGAEIPIDAYSVFRADSKRGRAGYPGDVNREPTGDPIIVSEIYREHYAGLYSVPAPSSHYILLRLNYDWSVTVFVFVVDQGRTKDVILIERVQRSATKMVDGLRCADNETRLAVLDLFLLGYRRLQGKLILTYALFEYGLANRTPFKALVRLYMRVLALASILPRVEKLKNSATPFFTSTIQTRARSAEKHWDSIKRSREVEKYCIRYEPFVLSLSRDVHKKELVSRKNEELANYVADGTGRTNIRPESVETPGLKEVYISTSTELHNDYTKKHDESSTYYPPVVSLQLIRKNLQHNRLAETTEK